MADRHLYTVSKLNQMIQEGRRTRTGILEGRGYTTSGLFLRSASGFLLRRVENLHLVALFLEANSLGQAVLQPIETNNKDGANISRSFHCVKLLALWGVQLILR